MKLLENRTCSFLPYIAIYILSRTVFKLSRIIGRIFAFDTPLEWTRKRTITKVGFKKLETPMYLRCKMYFDLLNQVWLTNVTDGRIDGVAFSNSAV